MKQSVLLSERLGVNDKNWSLTSGVTAMLKPINTCMTLLQTTCQPLQPRIRRIVRKMLRTLDSQFVGKPDDVPSIRPVWPQPYIYWRRAMLQPAINKGALVKALTQ